MIDLPTDIFDRLRANADATRAAQIEGLREPDHHPVLKLFNPLGAATWIATELDEDGDVLFGLADLGFGCPELGSFSLHEIGSVRLPFGLAIERDIAFEPLAPISRWADTARREGSILAAEAALRSNPLPSDPTPDLG
ncbi:DUF2958 domain-containing protein [Sphingomonas oligoaromativorans]|uniref:DUF2958 domain-containing protein n=1 Tax=Sphingomonas oligoaromativorans TaxID=575322 RepID=UPI001422C077|nr:DUF2958 domain-containing protein [Sphingomonas oligoaromativorans]NIJ34088.1 hypothetical protein [Sphingomonas oligoaromativorans]